jgi:hypothetical protein
MSETQTTGGVPAGATREDLMSALFAQLVMQQANMAMMLLGKVAHPETGQVIKDMDSARLFIDQLEMLEAKTKGNLTKEESGLLKQSLMSLRLAFVESIESPQPESAPARPSTPSAGVNETARPAPAPGSSSAEEEEHRKKFSKKY